MSGRRIALGFTMRRETDAVVALRWIDLLRRSPWPGPTYNGRADYIAQARNQIVKQALADSDSWDALLFWDSDQLPPAQVPISATEAIWFTQYLSLIEGAVIGGLYYSREDLLDLDNGVTPHRPIAYIREGHGYRHLTPDELIPMLRARGPYTVDGLGTGSMLIDKAVLFELSGLKAPRPVFETPDARDGMAWTEDLLFCREVQDMLKLPIILDTMIESAHRADVWVSTKHYLAGLGLRSEPTGTGAPPARRGLIYGPDGAPL